MEKFIHGLKKLKNISFLLLLFSTALLAIVPVHNTAIPGGIAVIDFETTHHNPKAFYYNTPLYVQHINGKHWQALLGIPLLEKLGKKTLTIQGYSTRSIVIEIKKHVYSKQYITLKGKNKTYLNPDFKKLARIKKERVILSQARKVFSLKLLAKDAFINPVSAVIVSSPFGGKRFYNNIQSSRPHIGLDYAGNIGTPVKAAAAGKIILIGNYFFNGNTIFLDHGQGLISTYLHLDKILVKPNQLVKQGEIIATIGQTGRATGSHLHWGVYLNRAAINPTILL